MAISKTAARRLKEAHDLFGETAGYRQGDSVTTATHKTMLLGGMSHLKSVFYPEIGDEPVSSGLLSGGPQGNSQPLTAPPVGSTYGDQFGKSARRLTKDEEGHCRAALNVAEQTARHPDMHRPGRSMLKEAMGHIRGVLVAHAGEKGASPDDLAARLVGALAGGKAVAPGVLVMLKETVDAAYEELPERIIEAALADN